MRPLALVVAGVVAVLGVAGVVIPDIVIATGWSWSPLPGYTLLPRAQNAFLAAAAALLPAVASTQIQGNTPPETPDVIAIREGVTRFAIGTFEPPCRNYWDRTTYCLEFEGGEQPTMEFLKRLQDVAPGLHSVTYCKETLGMRGQTIDPLIRIGLIALRSRDEATVDLVAFCGHGTLTVKRVAGEWQPPASVGGWVGYGPVPADCEGSGLRARKKVP